MDVFSCFPNAIVRDMWEMGRVQRGTTRGKVFSEPITCDVIVDESTYATTDRSPDLEYEDSDTLIYAMPAQMPTLNTSELAAGYLWHNVDTGLYYEIREANLGKNQDTGEIEHIEFLLRPTKVVING